MGAGNLDGQSCFLHRFYLYGWQDKTNLHEILTDIAAKRKPRRGDFANGVLDGSYRKVVVFMKCTQKSSDNPLPGRSCHVSYTHRKHHKEDHHGTDQRTGRGIRAS